MSDEFFSAWSTDLDQRKVDQSPLVKEVRADAAVQVKEKEIQTNQKLAQSEQGLIPNSDYSYADREIAAEKSGTPREEGWYENQYYKPQKRVVMGHDIGSGEKIYSELDESDDNVNYQVRKGVEDLQKGRTSDEGPDDSGFKGMVRFATASRMDGVDDYQEFAQQVRSMGYPEASVQAAWNAGTRTTQRVELQQELEAPPTDEEMAAAEATEPPDLQVNDLYSDDNWQTASEILYQAEEGQAFEGSPEDLMEWSINEMSNFNWRIYDMGYYAVQANSRGGDYAQALGYLINTYDRVDTDFNIFKKSAGAFFTDPTNLMGFGGGAIASRVAAAVAKNRLKKILASSTAQGAITAGFEGALFGGGEDVARQTVDIAAGNQEGYDVGQTAAMTGITTAAAATLGGTLALSLSEPARKMYKNAGRKMLDNAKAARPMPRWSARAQSGRIGEVTPLHKGDAGKVSFLVDRGLGEGKYKQYLTDAKERVAAGYDVADYSVGQLIYKLDEGMSPQDTLEVAAELFALGDAGADVPIDAMRRAEAIVNKESNVLAMSALSQEKAFLMDEITSRKGGDFNARRLSQKDQEALDKIEGKILALNLGLDDDAV